MFDMGEEDMSTFLFAYHQHLWTPFILSSLTAGLLSLSLSLTCPGVTLEEELVTGKDASIHVFLKVFGVSGWNFLLLRLACLPARVCFYRRS
jgi:hypothetical protein